MRSTRGKQKDYISYKLTYASDVDFLSTTGFKDINEIGGHLGKFRARRGLSQFPKVKKMKSLHGDSEDIDENIFQVATDISSTPYG